MPATDPGSVLDGKTEARVLIVDDHVGVRTSLMRLITATRDLQLAGAAASGEDAIDFCRNDLPDVVLMDIRLSGIDGVETVRRLVTEHPGIRIVMLTSLASPRTIARAFEAGAVDYLLKDDPIRRILETIRSAAAEKPALRVPALAD